MLMPVTNKFSETTFDVSENLFLSHIIYELKLRTTIFVEDIKLQAENMVKELFQYYLSNQDELVKAFNNKYIVISNDHIVNAFDDEDEGYYFAVEKYGLGNFLLQLCTSGEDAYTQHIYSPIAVF